MAKDTVMRHPITASVFVVGLVIRAVLLPRTYGQDFAVWDLASRYTLSGVNIYASHPPYPGGPFAYIPFFLYVELPFQWLAIHFHLPFTVLGKLPIVAGDLLAAGVIAAWLSGLGLRERQIALGTALFLLNPLVLYNTAFYGRFDTVCVGLYALALYLDRQPRSGAWRFALPYALAVATKSYPIFLLPWIWQRDRRRQPILIILLAVIAGLSLPYLLGSPARFIADIILYDGQKLPVHFSWQVVLLGHLPARVIALLGFGLLAFFLFGLIRMAGLERLTYALVSILLFIVFSKVVIEQYFVWPLPFLIVYAATHRAVAAWALLVVLSSAGMLANPYIHPFGDPAPLLNVAVVVAIAAFLVTLRPQSDGVTSAYEPRRSQSRSPDR